MSKQFFVLINQHCMAKNKLQQEYQQRVKEDFDRTLVSDPEEVVKMLKALEKTLNELHNRCRPITGTFQDGLNLTFAANYFVDSLFVMTFYEVKEVPNV